MLKQRQCWGRALINVVALVTAIGAVGTALPGWAVKFKAPATLRRPGSRVGLATRGGNTLCSADSQRALTTLVPTTLYGQTLSGYPTFYWYMPNRNTYESARFDLYDATDANQKLVYRSQFQISGEAGIARLTLPANTTISPLAVGKTYRWRVVLVCPERPSRNIFAEGWVERVSPSAELKADLAAAALRDHGQVYAKAGLWYDMLKALADQRQAHIADTNLTEEWNNLMTSEVVALPKMVAQPLITPEMP